MMNQNLVDAFTWLFYGGLGISILLISMGLIKLYIAWKNLK